MSKAELYKIQNIEDEKLIFGLLPVVANKIQVVADKSGDEVTLKQWLLIIIISQFQHEAPTLTEVAEAMGSSRQNVKQLALKLQAKGFIKIEQDPKDGRALKLSICPKCITFFNEKLAYQAHFLELLYTGLSKEEMKHMAGGLYKLLINIDHMEQLTKGGYKI